MSETVPLTISPEARTAAVVALAAEVRQRDEWYGLDNWGFDEVVDFVANRIEEHGNPVTQNLPA